MAHSLSLQASFNPTPLKNTNVKFYKYSATVYVNITYKYIYSKIYKIMIYGL